MTAGTFLLSVTGQIEFVDDILPAAGTTWHCKYEFVTGTDWKIVAGLEAGLTQSVTIVTNGEKIVFNMPLETVFKSTNPYGWPQIVLSIYRDMQLQGYGRIHIPFQPSSHKLTVKLSKPEPTSFLGYLGTFFGYQPELLQPKMLATTSGNNLIRMVSQGQAQITVNLMFQNFHALGYDVGSKKININC